MIIDYDVKYHIQYREIFSPKFSTQTYFVLIRLFMHCVDTSRNKYLLYTQNKWKVDNNGQKILDTAINKIKGLYDTIINYNDSIDVRDKKLKNIGEFIDLERKGKSKLLKNIGELALIKNIK